MNGDILTELERRFGRKRLRTKLAKRYRIMSGDGTRASRKIYTRARARKIAARAKRWGIDCYLSPMMVRVRVVGGEVAS